MSPLSDIEIQRALGTLPGWARKGDALVKSYHFATFPDAIAFIGRVADVAEQMNHHPDIDIRYTKLHFVLTSHDAKGITNRDLALAKSIEDLAAELGRWVIRGMRRRTNSRLRQGVMPIPTTKGASLETPSCFLPIRCGCDRCSRAAAAVSFPCAT